MSTGYSGQMVDMGNAAVWTWDARPYPDLPARRDVWADAPNWRLGHWLNGPLGAVGLATLVRELCARAGLDATRIDTATFLILLPGSRSPRWKARAPRSRRWHSISGLMRWKAVA